MESKQNQIRQMQEKLMQLQPENQSYKSKEDSNAAVLGELRNLKNLITCEEQSREITLLKSQAKSDIEKLNEYETQFRIQNETIIEMKKRIEKLKSGDVTTKGKSSCIAFENSSAVQQLFLSNNYTLNVLCNAEIAGSGWTVIQQRLNGAESFDRNWTSYRNGFGSFEGDFFLGLENIYRLTSEQPHELYIHMERFNGSSYYARYNKFALTAENDQYRLYKLGKFSGHTLDLLSYHINSQFSTFDRSQGNCLKYFTGGWWYKNCAYWWANPISKTKLLAKMITLFSATWMEIICQMAEKSYIVCTGNVARLWSLWRCWYVPYVFRNKQSLYCFHNIEIHKVSTVSEWLFNFKTLQSFPGFNWFRVNNCNCIYS